jgi:uncharacterized membrane protein YsdA (DUF1294 family)
MSASMMMFDVTFYLLLGLFLLMNIIGFIIMGMDKYKARKKLWRIPEKTFFIVAVFGGAVGVYAGMLFFRHKTKHWYFMLGVPAILLAELIITFFILN